MTDKYLSTRDLTNRFRCSSRTIYRKMRRDNNPLPSPVIKQAGSFNLWCATQVSDWEYREFERTANMNTG